MNIDITADFFSMFHLLWDIDIQVIVEKTAFRRGHDHNDTFPVGLSSVSEIWIATQRPSKFHFSQRIEVRTEKLARGVEGGRIECARGTTSEGVLRICSIMSRFLTWK